MIRAGAARGACRGDPPAFPSRSRDAAHGRQPPCYPALDRLEARLDKEER